MPLHEAVIVAGLKGVVPTIRHERERIGCAIDKDNRLADHEGLLLEEDGSEPKPTPIRLHRTIRRE
jgi:hypothetical protein